MLTAAVSDMILPTHTQQPPTPPHPILVLSACLDGGAVCIPWLLSQMVYDLLIENV